MTAPYFDELAGRLRDRGIPAKEVAGAVDDLAAYVAGSGADPDDEFGTPEEFAARLARSGEGDGIEPPPGPADETWLWTADAFHERSLLNRFGDEGWEVERVDSVGRFVTHRDTVHPQRWEYRREAVPPRRRDAVAERLRPDGWEPCGTWLFYEYFKRPKAATLGLEAELGSRPRVSARRLFWSRRFYVFLVCYIGVLAAVCVAWIAYAPADSRSPFVIGFLIGGVLAAAAVVVRRRRDRDHETR